MIDSNVAHLLDVDFLDLKVVEHVGQGLKCDQLSRAHVLLALTTVNQVSAEYKV